MDEVEGWWITANVRRVPMSACRVEDRFFNLCGELCTMENEMKIHSQLDETKLKLDSSSLYYEVDPTGPALARSVSERSPRLNVMCNINNIIASSFLLTHEWLEL